MKNVFFIFVLLILNGNAWAVLVGSTHVNRDINRIRIVRSKQKPLETYQFFSKNLSQKKQHNTQLRPYFFASKGDLSEVGEIVGSYEDHTYFREYDEVFIRQTSKELKVGQRYSIINYGKKVKNPFEGGAKDLGDLVYYLGELEILEVGRSLAKARLIKVWDLIKRGTPVVIYRPPVSRTQSSVASQGVEAKVVRGSHPKSEIVGQEGFILINRGAQSGVRKGHLFGVYDEQDPVTRTRDNVMREFKGRALIVHADANSSIGLVLSTHKPIEVGDEVLSVSRQQRVSKRAVPLIKRQVQYID